MTDLELCFDALRAKQAVHTMRWKYYDGLHPIAFINPKMDQVIPNGTIFKKNWCQVIVNASRDRLKVQEWAHEQDGLSEQMQDAWQRILKQPSSDLHTASLTTGEAFLVIWEGPKRPVAYYHDPRQAHVIYEAAMPDVPRVACKRWAEDKKHYINIYYPDRIEHYEAEQEPHTAGGFKQTSVEGHPYGVIPVFHFRTSLRSLTGELTASVLSLQDAMNKLLNDMMVSSEYSAFPQRWGIGHWDEQTGGMRVGAGTILRIPAGEQGDQPNSVGTFEATDPKNFLEPIDSLADAIAVLSATPKHYFSGQGANVSGEALQAMEAPLIAKLELYQQTLGTEWARAMAFTMALQGQTVDAEDIECIWQPPHTVQPQSQAETRYTNMQAGIPIINQLRDEGWTEDQIDQLLEDARRMQPAKAPGPQGNIDEQADAQQSTIDRKAPALQASLLSALEAVNVELVDRLTRNGTLDRMRGAVT